MDGQLLPTARLPARLPEAALQAEDESDGPTSLGKRSHEAPAIDTDVVGESISNFDSTITFGR